MANGNNPLLAQQCLAAACLALPAAAHANSANPAAKLRNPIYAFKGGNNGIAPGRNLVADKAGNLYGVAADSNNGIIYKVTLDGTETVFHRFEGKDGSGPNSLTADAAGNLYGTTFNGGTSFNGAVFKLTPAGKETVLYSFKRRSDGGNPISLTVAPDGTLYGTTQTGVPIKPGHFNNNGLVFKLTQDGTETVLHNFQGGSDGSLPYADLIIDAAGNLYGITLYGGVAASGISNGGIVFKVTQAGTETILYTFQFGADGAHPAGGLLADAAGNLYGTAGSYGAFGYGNVFELTTGGTLTPLYSFKGGSDGGGPDTTLIADAGGNLYGTTYAGGQATAPHGTSNCGTVFKLAPGGVETILHTFQNFGLGCYASGNLLAGKYGQLYGTTLGSFTGNGSGNGSGPSPYGAIYHLHP